MDTPPEYQVELFQEFERLLPGRWFASLREGDGPMYPFLWGVCGALADLRYSVEAVRQQVFPERAEGFWLGLHLRGIGLQRTTGETDPEALLRYKQEFRPTRNTRAGLRAYIEAIARLPVGAVRIKTDFDRGRFGSVRLVVQAQSSGYRSLGWDWPRKILLEQIANGIQPSVDLSLRDLIALPLPPWEFDTPFPMGLDQLGPLYVCPSLSNDLRLPDLSRNHFAWLTAADWSLMLLNQIFAETHASGQPGAQFAYLVDPVLRGAPTPPGGVPLPGTPAGRFVELQYFPPRIRAEEIRFRRRGFDVEGFTHQDTFPRQGAMEVEEEFQIEVNVAGRGIERSQIFPAGVVGVPQFDLASAWNRIPAAALRLVPLRLRPHVGIPIEWGHGGWPFPTLPFPHNERYEFTAGTRLRQIPDSTTVEFALAQEPLTELGQAWRMRGNYRPKTDFRLPRSNDLRLPAPGDYRLGGLVGLEDYPSITLNETDAQIIHFFPGVGSFTRFVVAGGGYGLVADYADLGDLDWVLPLSYGFRPERPQLPWEFYSFQSYPFASMADLAASYEIAIPQPDLTGFIPNVRAAFTRGWITEWFEVLATLEVEAVPDRLVLMGRGPWSLRIGAGDPAWGMTPPGGISPLQNEIARLEPSSVWWTDASGILRSPNPDIDLEGVAYLAVEFLLPRGRASVIRELELSIGYPQPVVPVQYRPLESMNFDTDLGGWDLGLYRLPALEDWNYPEEINNFLLPVLEIVEYRRLAIALNPETNFGVVFRIATKVRETTTTILPAFRTGQSRIGDPLRDRDYQYAI